MYKFVAVTEVWTVLEMVWVMVERVAVEVHGGRVDIDVVVTVLLAVRYTDEVFVAGFSVVLVCVFVVVL